MIKVLLVSVIRKEREEEARLPPLGLASLAAYTRKYFPDQAEFKIVDRNLESEIEKFQPDIVGISSVTQNYNRAIEIAKECKEKSIFTIMGGIHISMLPHTLSKDMNLGIVGEGEQTFLEIIKEFKRAKEINKNIDELTQEFNYGSIKGIIYWKEDKQAFTETRPLIENLDDIPPPARDLIEIDSNNVHMFTSRGCPYKCVFCASTRFWNKVRFHSAEYVVDDIKDLIEKYKIKNVSFYDDLFIADKKRLAKIVELLEKENIKIGFYLSARANLVNEEVLTLLKKMNTKTISMGLESGNNRVLQYLKGENINITNSENAVKLIRKFGFNMTATFIMGAPDETKEEIMDTYKFIKKLDIEDFDIYLLTPLPGTPIWDYALKRGIISNDMDWSELDIVDYSHFEDKKIISETLNSKELFRLYQKFQKLKKQRRIKFLIKEAVKKPSRILPFIGNKMKYIFQK